MKVIGFHPTKYDFDDGRSSSGYTLYLSEPITQQGGAGVITEKVYLSNIKLGQYIPAIGDEVVIDRAASGTVRKVILLKSYATGK